MSTTMLTHMKYAYHLTLKDCLAVLRMTIKIFNAELPIPLKIYNKHFWKDANVFQGIFFPKSPPKRIIETEEYGC